MAKVTLDVEKNPWERYGWLMAVVWMVFLAYPVIALVTSAAEVEWIITGWIALVVFAVVYVYGFMRGFRSGRVPGDTPPPSQYGVLGVLCLCALVSIPAEGASALSFLPFIMSFTSYGLSRTAHWIVSISATVLTAACVIWAPDGIKNLGLLVIVTLLFAVNSISTWLIRRAADADVLGRELATSEGREAVARDVHDLIGHSLTVINLKAQLAERLIDTNPAQAKIELAHISELATEAIAGVRQTVAGARASSLPEQLLASVNALESAGITVQVTGDAAVLSAAQGLTASWILREATTNILRHAQARTVSIALEPGTISVRDDGRGISENEGNGIRGMRERAATAGARLVMSTPHTGGAQLAVIW
ncbi:sensor histidine kinase [Microbacterium sp. NC79]|uniref:sensor histidine kinase n=1 Tax=Microbacterium sp. NC79 TaxID=2851009 RepID=UPI001C2B8E85|nr:histidine kinase [Microbacterium sp. NC79]MBV0895464.1 sensor histidine kinase [Microbacterium sp. NC79]